MNANTLPTIQRTGIAALLALAVAAYFQNVWGNSPGENGGGAMMAFNIAINALVAAWLFLRVIPRAIEAGPQAAAKRATLIGAVGFLFVVLFWTGLPFVLGPAAVVLALEARRRGAGSAATAAAVLGGLAFVGAVVMTILDETSVL